MYNPIFNQRTLIFLLVVALDPPGFRASSVVAFGDFWRVEGGAVRRGRGGWVGEVDGTDGWEIV